jgi:hypothetical protein
LVMVMKGVPVPFNHGLTVTVLWTVTKDMEADTDACAASFASVVDLRTGRQAV